SDLDDAMRDVAEVRSGGHRALRADPHLVPPGGRPVARDRVESVALQARRRHAWDEEQDDRDDPPSRHDPWPPPVRDDPISSPMHTKRRLLSRAAARVWGRASTPRLASAIPSWRITIVPGRRFFSISHRMYQTGGWAGS